MEFCISFFKVWRIVKDRYRRGVSLVPPSILNHCLDITLFCFVPSMREKKFNLRFSSVPVWFSRPFILVTKWLGTVRNNSFVLGKFSFNTNCIFFRNLIRFQSSFIFFCCSEIAISWGAFFLLALIFLGSLVRSRFMQPTTAHSIKDFRTSVNEVLDYRAGKKIIVFLRYQFSVNYSWFFRGTVCCFNLVIESEFT